MFTDLDGTLLDCETGSFEPATPGLQWLKEMDIPLILCSSKTLTEIEWLREQIGNRHPFVSENGGGIFVSVGYFDEGVLARRGFERREGYLALRFGASYADLRKALVELREEGFDLRGFGDMTAREVAEITGLDLRGARMAKDREFDEPFLFRGDAAALQCLLGAIQEKGMRCTEGRFLHLLGDTDKGRAVRTLVDLYRDRWTAVRTVAIGDSPMDLPMLEAVDLPILVQRSDGLHAPGIHMPNLVKAEGIGPRGWNRAVRDLRMGMQFPD